MAEVHESQVPVLQDRQENKRHPFQDLMYGLREEGLRVSTDES